MKSLLSRSLVIWAVFLVLFLLMEATSHAFVGSEEELMQAEIATAKARARAFQSYLRRAAEIERMREATWNQLKEERVREEARAEATRVEFVERRYQNQKRADEELARLEKEDELMRLAQEKLFEQSRQLYLRKRQKVQATIETEAWIDESIEYDLKYPPPELLQKPGRK